MLRALITGITGQDGSYLAEFLLFKELLLSFRKAEFFANNNLGNVKRR